MARKTDPLPDQESDHGDLTFKLENAIINRRDGKTNARLLEEQEMQAGIDLLQARHPDYDISSRKRRNGHIEFTISKRG